VSSRASRLSSLLEKYQHLSGWIQVLIALVGIPLAIGSLAVGIWAVVLAQQAASDKPADGKSPGAASTTSARTVPTDVPSPAKPATPSSPQCVTESGDGVQCSAPNAWLKIEVANCDDRGVELSLGNAVDLRPLLLEVGQQASTCVVRPNELARNSGATAASLLDPMSEKIDVLTACAIDAGRTMLTCAKPHTLEFVGGWIKPESGALTVKQCQPSAASYTQRNLVDDADLNIVVLSRNDGQARCALALHQSSRELKSSLWHVGPNPLPVTS
jgi:hypothetical protein